MDCKTARLWLEFHRPTGGELTAEDAAGLEAHLAACPECEAAVRAERAADAALARAMQAVPVPAGLPERLLARLEADLAAGEPPEPPPAEPAPTLPRLFRLSPRARVAALAAALMLAVGVGSLLWLRTRPATLDVAALRDREFAQYGSPRPDWVQEWFQTQHGVAMTAPPTFDYAYLVHYGLGSCQGRRVPELVFARDAARAHVYVLNRTQFDLAQLPAEPADLDSVGFKVNVWRHPEADDTAYLIFSSGESLEPLLAHDRPPPV